MTEKDKHGSGEQEVDRMAAIEPSTEIAYGLFMNFRYYE